MVISCSAYGCSNKWSRQGPIHFHKFPFRSRVLCEKWISALKRKDFVPTRASLVCSAHFTEDDYVKKPELTKKRLRNDAVPSVFNFPVNDLSNTFQIDQYPPTSTYNVNGKKRRSKKIYNPVDDVDFDSLTTITDNSLLSEITSVTRQADFTAEEITLTGKGKSLEAKDIDSFIRELVVYEEIDFKNNSRPEGFVNDEEHNIDDLEDDLARMAEADEDDKCCIIGNIWGERLKQLPADMRPKVKKIINRVFEEARKGNFRSIVSEIMKYKNQFEASIGTTRSFF